MKDAASRDVRDNLKPQLARLWRYAMVLTRSPVESEELVQMTCLRAIERADQFQPGTRLDRWLFSIQRSIWLNELRSRGVRQGEGTVEAETALVEDGSSVVEANILASQVLFQLSRMSAPLRETALLVYAEGYTYAEAAAALGAPIGTIMSRLAAVRSAFADWKE
jgi:RNA polymerase sigma-70 factor, ECF subfamily